MLPHCVPARWPEGISDRRIASKFVSLDKITPAEIAAAVAVGPVIALLGIPNEEGVRLNGGRPGAAQGPTAFRAALARYGAAGCVAPMPALFLDAGDVNVEPSLELAAIHDRIREAASALHALGVITVAIGGGHDSTYPYVGAACATRGVAAGLYFDAHLDVRPDPGSGMPFRSLVTRCGVRSLSCFGMDPFSNTAEHAAWFAAHGGVAQPSLAALPAAIEREAAASPALFVSLCLDALDMSAAPGVSAPCPAGLSPGEMCAAVRTLGRCGRVVSFDLMELSPPHDEGGRTARLAARLFLEFCSGVASRGAE